MLGIAWTEGMSEADGDGWIHATGEIIGGHAILARGVDVDESSVLLHNSWGPDWGRKGTCRISYADLGELLDQDGEACVPVTRL